MKIVHFDIFFSVIWLIDTLACGFVYSNAVRSVTILGAYKQCDMADNSSMNADFGAMRKNLIRESTPLIQYKNYVAVVNAQ